MSARCDRLLREATREERKKLGRPPPALPERASELQDALHDAWRRFGLQRFLPASVTPRQQMLLTKTVQAPVSECAELVDLFSFDLLNRLAYGCETAPDVDRRTFVRVCIALSELPVRLEVRWRLWATALGSAGPDDLPWA